jgi:hypothetical protein
VDDGFQPRRRNAIGGDEDLPSSVEDDKSWSKTTTALKGSLNMKHYEDAAPQGFPICSRTRSHMTTSHHLSRMSSWEFTLD